VGEKEKEREKERKREFSLTKPVTSQTMSRWIKQGLEECEVDTTMFSAPACTCCWPARIYWNIGSNCRVYYVQ